MISLTDVTMTYGDLTVLGPVTLDIPAGGVTALVGPNGAGKSTLLTIVGRLATATSGRVTIAGHDVTTTPGRALAKIVSILRQENHFVTRLTVRELVGFGRFPHSHGRLTADDHARIDEAIAFLDLTELSGRYLDQLSGGQRQRAYVAMVLAQDTDYILLDEPLNNLDMKHAVAMMGQLRRAADELGKTIVIVVHDINFAAAYADRIVALSDGRVVHVGTPDDLMTSSTLENVFGTPVEVRRDGPYPLAVYYR
ncbi:MULTISPECIES: ABC transporter ATP-binding protein [Microbacterium]|uniref:iron ABC transporter ATP-binding protein n=1 Tax=Microbacterium TaxID=33882 RepID=UPI0027882D3C|nr:MULTISPECIES: ATP-binding cassette domain-containing protein [Microbacterium]MDQ1075740.1 iron complex transport system ATP-binding protein [Microbacterium sp. SORGH_AS_0969]MDQ1115983.1 iron complex transport system ATP-binding protein [Microbacterium testaceum]